MCRSLSDLVMTSVPICMGLFIFFLKYDNDSVVSQNVVFACDLKLLHRSNPYLPEKVPLDVSVITCVACPCNKGLWD